MVVLRTIRMRRDGKRDRMWAQDHRARYRELALSFESNLVVVKCPRRMLGSNLRCQQHARSIGTTSRGIARRQLLDLEQTKEVEPCYCYRLMHRRSKHYTNFEQFQEDFSVGKREDDVSILNWPQ